MGFLLRWGLSVAGILWATCKVGLMRAQTNAQSGPGTAPSFGSAPGPAAMAGAVPWASGCTWSTWHLCLPGSKSRGYSKDQAGSAENIPRITLIVRILVAFFPVFSKFSTAVRRLLSSIKIRENNSQNNKKYRKSEGLTEERSRGRFF